MDSLEWSANLAALTVDELVDAGMVRKEDFDQAVAIASEEINVRLCLRDYLPPRPTNSLDWRNAFAPSLTASILCTLPDGRVSASILCTLPDSRVSAVD